MIKIPVLDYFMLLVKLLKAYAQVKIFMTTKTLLLLLSQSSL